MGDFTESMGVVGLLSTMVLLVALVLAALYLLKRRKIREQRLLRQRFSARDSEDDSPGGSQHRNDLRKLNNIVVGLERRILILEEKLTVLRNDLARAASGMSHKSGHVTTPQSAGGTSVSEQYVSTSELPNKYDPITVSAGKPSPAAERDAGKPQPQAGTTYFAPIPEPDGTFKMSELKKEAAWDALYEIQTTGADSAVVTLCKNPDQFKTAVQAPQRYLDPVCTYRKEPGQETTNIVLRAAGSAVREDQRWKIHTKLEIEFV